MHYVLTKSIPISALEKHTEPETVQQAYTNAMSNEAGNCLTEKVAVTATRDSEFLHLSMEFAVLSAQDYQRLVRIIRTLAEPGTVPEFLKQEAAQLKQTLLAQWIQPSLISPLGR